MIESDELFEISDPRFEESIRIDRDLETEDPAERREAHYNKYLDNYYLTDASEQFLQDLFAHIRDDLPASDERNHWLYGYYGSGKSHLLTVLDLLLDTQQLEAADDTAVWGRLDNQDEYPNLSTAWQALHDELVVIPLSINLLRYQSVREQSFSEIILQEVYKQRNFADRLEVAFFEEEFQRTGGMFDTRKVWENREHLTNEILREEGVRNPAYEWSDVQQYQILSNIVLEGLTARATGMTDNLSDIQNQNIGQELAVAKIEAYRQELKEQFDRPVKIILLMDEVTLFIGGNYQRLSELNALAESIKDVGNGNILSVVTAQSKIEDVQPGLAVKQLNFGILKDRFPQQYELPSRHVGDIVQQRLLTKSHSGRQWLEDSALTARVHPNTMLTYREVAQDMDPSLKTITDEQFVAYYPLLPYQPTLFMEILSNLRDQLPDATKSIFSGTARALLSIVAGLRAEWVEKDGEKPIISLVDFYDLVQYELKDIIPEKTTVIEDIEADEETTDFDVKVAKAVLLLSYVSDIVPQTDAHLATAVMDDLEGQPRANVQTRVRDSLDGNLGKYIRPDTSTDGGNLRIADQEEQRLQSSANEYEADPDWDKIITELDDRLWENIVAELELPKTHEWEQDSDGTAYLVGYSFSIDGQALSTENSDDVVFDVDVVIRGLRPDVEDTNINPATLYWCLETEGLEELRTQLVEWWALVEATRKTNPPESIVGDLNDAANRVINKLTSALSNGTFTVEADEFTSFQAALDEYINGTDTAYPSYFHPELARIDDSHLDELRHLDDDEELPSWARTIGVPPQSATDFATFSDLAFRIRKLVGTELQENGDGIDLATILDRVIEEEPLFAEETNDGKKTIPAVLAVLWGLIRAGVFRLTTIDNEPVALDAVLDLSEHTSLTLLTVKIGDRPKDVFVEHDIIEPTESGNQGYINFTEWLESVETRANALADDVGVQVETSFETETMETVIRNLKTTVEDIATATSKRREDAMTDDTDLLEELIEATEEDGAVLEMAETRWEERRPFLYQIEGLLRPELREIGWLDADIRTSIETLSDQIDAASEIDWWSDDGWTTFVSKLEARQPLIQALEDAWDEQQAVTDLKSIQADLEDHSWLIGAAELPLSSVHDSFRLAYLDPLRNFRTSVERIQMVFDALLNPEPGSNNEAALTQALGRLNGRIDWDAVTETNVAERRAQLSTLDQIVGEATPEELVGIGVLYGDADALRAQIEALDVEDEVPELIEVDEGVIIR